MDDLATRGLDRLATAQSKYDESVLSSNPPQRTAFVEGYNKDSGRYAVRTVRGDRIEAAPESTGSYGVGDKTWLVQTHGSTPYVSAMP